MKTKLLLSALLASATFGAAVHAEEQTPALDIKKVNEVLQRALDEVLPPKLDQNSSQDQIDEAKKNPFYGFIESASASFDEATFNLDKLAVSAKVEATVLKSLWAPASKTTVSAKAGSSLVDAQDGLGNRLKLAFVASIGTRVVSLAKFVAQKALDSNPPEQDSSAMDALFRGYFTDVVAINEEDGEAFEVLADRSLKLVADAKASEDEDVKEEFENVTITKEGGKVTLSVLPMELYSAMLDLSLVVSAEDVSFGLNIVDFKNELNEVVVEYKKQLAEMLLVIQNAAGEDFEEVKFTLKYILVAAKELVTGEAAPPEESQELKSRSLLK